MFATGSPTLEKARFDLGGDVEDLETELARIGDVGSFPADAKLLRDHVALSKIGGGEGGSTPPTPPRWRVWRSG
jgi:hypothetical protein